jgi:hypothetical protein
VLLIPLCPPHEKVIELVDYCPRADGQGDSAPSIKTTGRSAAACAKSSAAENAHPLTAAAIANTNRVSSFRRDGRCLTLEQGDNLPLSVDELEQRVADVALPLAERGGRRGSPAQDTRA